MKGIVSLLVVLISLQSIAQQSIEDDAVNAADEICGCLNQVFEELELHPELVNILKGMKDLNEEEAQQHFMLAIVTLDSDVQQEVMKSMENMSKMEEVGNQVCPDMGGKYASYQGSDEFTDLVNKELLSREECEIAQFFFNMITKGEK